MMRINIAICDDEQKSLQMIQKELYHIADKLKIEIETYAYKEGKKVLDLIYNEKEDFDVLFQMCIRDSDHHECSILGNEEIKNRLFSLDHISLSKENNLFLYIFTKLIY